MVKIETREEWNHRLARRTDKLAYGLQALVEMETKVADGAPGAVEDWVVPDALRTYTLALMVELCELLAEFNWKPWKLPTDVDREKMMEEFADVLAFLGIIARYVLLAANCTTDELAQAFATKSSLNMERLAGHIAGYGVNHKGGEQG